MSDPQQHLFECTDPDCPVVTFIDRIWDTRAVDKDSGLCPSDVHEHVTSTEFNVYLGPYTGEKAY